MKLEILVKLRVGRERGRSMELGSGGSSQDLFQWLGSPPFISQLGHLEGEQPYLGDLLATY